MKKVLGLVCLLTMFLSVAPVKAEGVTGFVYKNATEAGVGFTPTPTTRVGTATCKSYFGIVATGDCSICAAAKAGNVKTISYYDTYTKNILGFKTVKTKVFGQ